MSSIEQIQGRSRAGSSPWPNHWRSKAALWATTASQSSTIARKQASPARQGWGSRVVAASMPLIATAGLVWQGSRNDTCISTSRWGTANSTAPTSMQVPSVGERPVVSVSRISRREGTVGRGAGSAWNTGSSRARGGAGSSSCASMRLGKGSGSLCGSDSGTMLGSRSGSKSG